MNKPIDRVFVDTSILWSEILSGDFGKLLDRSKNGKLRVIVSHIAWEERRTQFLERACELVRKIRDPFENLENRRSSDFVLQSLIPPKLSLWSYEQIEEQSKEAMSKFAADHKIEILGIKSEHAERSWRGFFRYGVSPPYRETTERKQRRLDIPDSWIYETAVDLMAEGEGLVALCADGALSSALKALGIQVFASSGALVTEIEQAELETQAAATAPAPAPEPELATAPTPEPTPLDGKLSAADDRFRSLERRLLGYVAYLGTPTKDQIFGLVARDKVSLEMAKNAAERLVINGLLGDTGNHFVVPDAYIARQMRDAVEPEIIELLKG